MSKKILLLLILTKHHLPALFTNSRKYQNARRACLKSYSSYCGNFFVLKEHCTIVKINLAQEGTGG
jgi:hypothetical protein